MAYLHFFVVVVVCILLVAASEEVGVAQLVHLHICSGQQEQLVSALAREGERDDAKQGKWVHKTTAMMGREAAMAKTP